MGTPSGIDNLKEALKASFRNDLSSSFCSYVGMAAFRNLFHFLVKKKSDKLRLATKVSEDWARFVRDTSKVKLESLAEKYSGSLFVKEGEDKPDFHGIVHNTFEEAITETQKVIVESILEPGESGLILYP